jgi:hypothetical protein
MTKRLVAMLVCSALPLMGATVAAHADSVGRYECNILGTATPEPIGDRAGHGLLNYQFSCVGVEGLLKGVVYTATHISEWDGPQGAFLMAGGVHRTAGGFAVTQMAEGSGAVIMKDGKPVGTASSGKAIFKFASGPLASLSGKTLKFATRSVGFNRFDLEFAE